MATMVIRVCKRCMVEDEMEVLEGKLICLSLLCDGRGTEIEEIEIEVLEGEDEIERRREEEEEANRTEAGGWA